MVAGRERETSLHFIGFVARKSAASFVYSPGSMRSPQARIKNASFHFTVLQGALADRRTNVQWCAGIRGHRAAPFACQA
jgi:hypothetical protein